MFKCYLLALSFFVSAVAAFSQNVKAFGLSNSSNQYSIASVYDNSGNLFVVGAFYGNNFDVDPSAGTFYLNSQGSGDIYVAKYSSTGTLINAISIGGTDSDEGLGIAIDGSDNIYITGWFRNTVDFDPSGGVANVISNGHTGTDMGYNGEAFLAKYSNSLAYQWAFGIGGSQIDDVGLTVKVATDGGIILGGNFRGPNVDFDPSPSTVLRSAAGQIESFIAKYSSTGQFLWVSTIGGATTFSGQVRSLEVASNGNIYVLGHFDGSVDLDPGLTTNTVTSAGCGDIYLVKLNSTGQHQWGFKIGGSSCDYPVGMSIDPSENIYITGYYSSSNVDFNPGPATNSFSSVNSNTDIFVAKYDLNGNYVFAQSLGGTGNDVGYDIYATAGSYILVGNFENTIDLDVSPSAMTIVSAGGQDGFIAGFYPNGQINYGFRFGGTLNDAAYGISKRVPEEFTITGYYQGTNVDFDPNASTALLTSGGSTDAFFAIYSVVVLPLKLTDFNVFRDGKQNKLKWTTKNEQNSNYFEIQRSDNGKEFYSLGKINAAGGLDSHDYLSYDANPLRGTNYYRLKIFDKDGKYEFSEIKAVDNGSSVNMEMYPNPVKGGLNLRIFSEKKQNAQLVIIGIDGKVYQQKNISLINGTSNTALNTGILSFGSYYVHLITENDRVTLKFIK